MSSAPSEPFDWASFLRQWSEKILASSAREGVSETARAAGWLGCPPATDAEIEAAEARLKIALPPSYKAFLRTSNGWLKATRAVDQLRGAEQIDWFRKQNRNWIPSFSAPLAGEKLPAAEYFTYGNFSQNFEAAHLRETLQISDVGDSAVYLLNPQVISKDGEWEAWFLANWLPGVCRYRSFEEMMRAEYADLAGDEWSAPEGLIGELPDEYVGSPGSPKRKIKKRPRPRVRKILGKPYDQWSFEELMEMLQNREFGIIHDEVIEGLTLLGDPRAIEPMIRLLDLEGNSAMQAMYALKVLAPDELPALLLRSLENPDDSAHYAAAGLLAELKDDRAVPLLVNLMRNTSAGAAHEARYIGRSIAQFGSAGYDALVHQVMDVDPVIRLRAVDAIYYTNRAEAGPVIAPLLSDPDSAVRERAKSVLELLPRSREKPAKG